MKVFIFLCLLALSLNQVLMQTILIEDNNSKNIVRGIVLLTMVFFTIIKMHKVFFKLYFLLMVSVTLLTITFNIDQATFIFILIFVPALFLINTKDVEKYLLISSLAALITILAFLLLGITHNEVTLARNRMTFGTNGVPYLYNIVYGTFALMVIYSQKYFRRFKWLFTLISIASTTYFFVMTNSRAGYYTFLILIILLYLLPKIGDRKTIKGFIALIPEISLGISFIIASLHNNISANVILSLRPTYVYNFLSSLGLMDVVFSKSVKALDKPGTIVDNSYIHLLVGGGIILSIVVGILFFKAILKLYKEKKYIEISFIVATSVYFNMETNMVRIEHMYVIYFWYLLFRYSLNEKKSFFTKSY